MPSFDVHEKLHDGSGVWWSAADMLKSKKRIFSYSANDAPSQSASAESAAPISGQVAARAPIAPEEIDIKDKVEAEIDHALHYGGLHI